MFHRFKKSLFLFLCLFCLESTYPGVCIPEVRAGLFGDIVDKVVQKTVGSISNSIGRKVNQFVGNLGANWGVRSVNPNMGGGGYVGNSGSGGVGGGGGGILLSGNYDPALTGNRIAQMVNAGSENMLTKQGLFSTGTLGFVNRIFVTIAIIWLIIIGVKFIISQGDESKLTKYKHQFAWVVLGLAVISAAQYVAFDVFNPTQDVLRGAASSAFIFKANQIKTYFQIIAAGIALLACILSGYNLIVGGEEAVTNEKRFIQSFALGVGLILFSEVIVRIGTLQYYQNNAMGTAAQGVSELAGILNFTLSFLGAASVFMLVLASIYYVISFGDEALTKRAKSIITACIFSIIIILSSYAFVSYFVR